MLCHVSDQPRPADLRVRYDLATLDAADLPAAPLPAFEAWFAAAVEAELPEPNAMTLATADSEGLPSARMVLLKDVDARGFVFFTNLTSRKGRELEANPAAALVFPWLGLHRQVTVTGVASLLPRDEVDAYFRTRPRESQLGAWVSRQSQVIPDRSVLHEREDELAARFGDDEIPVPPFWGGWLIRPRTVEFWQGRPSRLHDRLRYRALRDGAALDDPTGWVLERLSP